MDEFFTLDRLKNISKDEFAKLSPENKELVLKILSEYSETGTSETLKVLWGVDYNEIPVSIDEFICNPYYLGKSTRNGESIYPYWRQKYREIFDASLNYEEIVLSGAIGIGKTRTAVISLCYLLYKLMCLKNPQEYFRFNEGDKITIFFLNITLGLAEGVGYTTMHEYLLNSDWFLERGTISGIKNKRYNPPHNIAITFGSKGSHALGQQIYCLSGDTKVLTTDGEYTMTELCGKKFKTYSMLDNGKIVVSDETTVLPTVKTNDYYEIELEDGSIVKCTPEHQFMLSDGTYKMAKDLSEDDDLMECKPFGYIYITTNTENGMRYIGQHGGMFNPRYKGSGAELRRAFRKFGKHKFVSKLICYCYTEQELNEMELYYIDKFNAVNSRDFYNQIFITAHSKLRDADVRRHIGLLASERHISNKTRKKISEQRYRNIEMKGTAFWINNGIEEHLVNETEWKTMYPAFKKGRLPDVVYMNKEGKSVRVHKADIEKYISDGYKHGKDESIGHSLSIAAQKERWVYLDFECGTARQLAQYLNKNGYPKIVKSTVVNIANGKFVKSYAELCGKIKRIPKEQLS